MFRTRNYKILSYLSLAVLVISPFIAYMKVGKIFVLHQVMTDKTFFQVVVWLIIIFGFMLFYLNWRLILHVDGQNAKVAEINEGDFIDAEQLLKKNGVEVDVDLEAMKIINDVSFGNNIDETYHSLLKSIAKHCELGTAIVFTRSSNDIFKPTTKWAYFEENEPAEFEIGYGLSGNVADSQKPVFLNDLKDNYLKIISSSGFASPKCLFILPVVINHSTTAVVELAFLKKLPDNSNDIFTKVFNIFQSRLNPQNT